MTNTTQMPIFCDNSTGFINCTVDNGPDNDQNGTQQLPLAFFLNPLLTKAYTIYLYTMITLGVPGNLLVLLVFIKHPPSTTTDWFILFITTFDFISSSVNVPIYATFTNGAWANYGNNLICRIHMFLSQSFVLSSSFLISGLALDRYVKVCRPNSKALTKARARNYCVIICALTFLLSIPCFTMYGNVHGRCTNSVTGNTIFLYYFMVFCTFVIATLAVVISYSLVSRAIFKSESNVNRHADSQGESRETKRGIFCCWCCKQGFYRNQVVPMSSMFGDSVMSSNADKPSTSDSAQESSSRQLTGNLKINIATSTNAWLTVKNEVSKTTPNYLTPVTAIQQKESRRQKPASRKTVSLRTTKIAFLVCSIFVITWIPPWVSFFLAMSREMLQKMKVIEFLIFGRMTYLLNTVTNPILYTWLNRAFRQRVKTLLTFRRR